MEARRSPDSGFWILERAFRLRPLPENVPRSEHSFWDAVSVYRPLESTFHSGVEKWDAVSPSGPFGKAGPTLSGNSGMYFPPGADPETTSRFGAKFWSSLSAKGRKGKERPIPSNTGTRFPPTTDVAKKGPVPPFGTGLSRTSSPTGSLRRRVRTYIRFLAVIW